MPKEKRPTRAREADFQEFNPEPDGGSGSASLMEAVFAKPSHIGSGKQADGVVIGTLTDIENGTRILVQHDFARSTEPIEALSTVELSKDHIGREVALAFLGGDPDRPLVLGIVQRPATRSASEPGADTEVLIDGERLTIDAAREIVLRCGNSSITLTRAGKIILKGEYVSSHSTGVNRIKGGSIQIN